MKEKKRGDCKKCRWHAKGDGINGVHCAWALYHAPHTCLHRIQSGEIVDRRGGEGEECWLFSEGTPNSRMISEYRH